MLAAVKQNGALLYLASEEIRNDKEVVLAAVKQWPYAIYEVGNWLWNDYDVLMAGVTSAYRSSPHMARLFLRAQSIQWFYYEVRSTMSLAAVNKHCYMNAKNEDRLTLLTEEGYRYFLIYGIVKQLRN